MLRTVLMRLVRSARLLDLYPVLPMLRLAAGGKSYHWGGSFPTRVTVQRPSAVTGWDAWGLGGGYTSWTHRSFPACRR